MRVLQITSNISKLCCMLKDKPIGFVLWGGGGGGGVGRNWGIISIKASVLENGKNVAED